MKPAIGMSVPGASDLGLGMGLTGQSQDETDEERRKRLLAMRQSSLLPSLDAGASSLYGGSGGFGG